MAKVALTNPKKTRGRPFQPGHPGGPGRPKGSRHKLSEDFLAKMLADFSEHGQQAIEDARTADPVAYVKTIASIIPKSFELDDEVAAGLTIKILRFSDEAA